MNASSGISANKINPLEEISRSGTSIWLDDLSRERLNAASPQSIARFIEKFSVVGVTTNPSIFLQAISNSDLYHDDIARLKGADVDTILAELTTSDVRRACDLFLHTHSSTNGQDGRVSIEVDPRLAHRTDETVNHAVALWKEIDRPNLMIKVPATPAGLPAITRLIAAGISVNVTLIFSRERYLEVMQAYLTGLEERVASGSKITDIHSVASFFVSRVDTAVDAKLVEIDTPEALDLRGKTAIANAHLAYEAFELFTSTQRWANVLAHGAHPQRPLWASTGVKNPDYQKTLYVAELLAPLTVNTMPESTLMSLVESTIAQRNSIEGRYPAARQHLQSLEKVGIDLLEILNELEIDGVAKFEQAWIDLIEVVAAKI